MKKELKKKNVKENKEKMKTESITEWRSKKKEIKKSDTNWEGV